MVQENNKFIEGDYVEILEIPEYNGFRWDHDKMENTGIVTKTLPGNQYRVNNLPVDFGEDDLSFRNPFKIGDVVRFRPLIPSQRRNALMFSNGFTVMHPYPMLVTKVCSAVNSPNSVELNGGLTFNAWFLEYVNVNQPCYESRGDILKEINRLSKMAIAMFE